MTIVLGNVFHVESPRMKHEENSLQGILEAAHKGFSAIDLDMIPDADDVVQNTHWIHAMQHDGFIDPAHEINRARGIPSLHTRQVERLVTRDGHFVIRPMRLRMKQCHRHGLKVRAEAKHFGRPWTRDHFAQLIVPDLHVRKWSVVATLDTYDDWRETLQTAHELGFETRRLRG